MAIATSELEGAFGLIHAHEPRAKLGGIVGDRNHSFGYHLARNELGPGDYSVMLPLDKKGPSDTASALDVTLPDDLMRTMTARLHDAALAHDYRLRGLREFCGTIDGRSTRSRGICRTTRPRVWTRGTTRTCGTSTCRSTAPTCTTSRCLPTSHR
jgi:hypothetical protein